MYVHVTRRNWKNGDATRVDSRARVRFGEGPTGGNGRRRPGVERAKGVEWLRWRATEMDIDR